MLAVTYWWEWAVPCRRLVLLWQLAVLASCIVGAGRLCTCCTCCADDDLVDEEEEPPSVGRKRGRPAAAPSAPPTGNSRRRGAAAAGAPSQHTGGTSFVVSGERARSCRQAGKQAGALDKMSVV